MKTGNPILQSEVQSEVQSEPEQPLDLSDFPDAAFEQWKQAAIAGLKGAPFEKMLQRLSLDGLRMEAMYTAENAPHILPLSHPPSTPWNIGQLYYCQSPHRLGKLIDDALRRGQTEVRIAFAPPAIDSNEAKAGQYQTIVSTVDCLGAALPETARDVAIRFECGSMGIAALSMFAALCNQRGWPLASWRGSLGYSPLRVLAAHGEAGIGEAGIFDEAVAVAKWMGQNAPLAGVGLIDGTVYHNAGASPALEMACCLSEASAYLKAFVAGGIPLHRAAAALSIQLAVGDDFFEDIAKLRGMRFLFAGLVTILGGAPDTALDLWARTSQLGLTMDEPLNNVLRGITASFSGALGGATSIHTAPFSEVFGETTEFAARIARNTQVILQRECRIAEEADPCGGSFYVERLTEQLAEAAWGLFGTLESQGGMIAALQSGQVAGLVDGCYQKREALLHRRKRKIVGVNDFVAFDDADASLLASAHIETDDCRQPEIASPPSSVSFDPAGDIVAQAIEAAANGATMGQIARVIPSGVPLRCVPLVQRRLAAGYEDLRRQVAALGQRRNRPCSVLLLRLGTVRETKARADFSRGFFNPAGFQITESPLCSDAESALQAARQAQCDITVLCSTDDKYVEMAAAVAALVAPGTPTMLVIAGRPGEMEAIWRGAGISDFIFLGADHFALLQRFLTLIGERHD